MNNPRYNNLQIHFGTQRGQEPIGLIRKSYAFKPLSLSLRHSEWVQVTEQNSLSAVRARIIIHIRVLVTRVSGLDFKPTKVLVHQHWVRKKHEKSCPQYGNLQLLLLPTGSRIKKIIRPPDP